jgi:predicted AAA+ superfamily ATPase
MIRRSVLPLLRQRLAACPAAALVGPRQSGKTTLARSLGGAYFDLEQEPDRLRLDLDWNRLIRGRKLIILDEAQAWPEVFPRLRGAIDLDRRRKGRFLLLGSVSPSLMVRVSESLAGRLALVELTPFLWGELAARPARNRLWLCGGFPDGGVLRARQFPRWQLDYLSLLIQRDLPNWGLPARPQTTRRLLAMLAATHGQMLNTSQLGQSLGVSYHTAAGYLAYLEGAFLIRLLPAFHASLKKRLVKSPRVYWRDPGLLHALLHVGAGEDLFSRPWVGASWEGFVIEQVLGTLHGRGRPVEATFLRTSDQKEIDLVLDFGRRRWAIEIKLTASPGPQDMARLNHAADLLHADRRILVSRTDSVVTAGPLVSANLEWLLDHLD